MNHTKAKVIDYPPEESFDTVPFPECRMARTDGGKSVGYSRENLSDTLARIMRTAARESVKQVKDVASTRSHNVRMCELDILEAKGDLQRLRREQRNNRKLMQLTNHIIADNRNKKKKNETTMRTSVKTVPASISERLVLPSIYEH